MIDIIHHIGNRLFCQVGDGVNGSEFHFFVDGCRVNVEGTSENVGEANDIIDLIGIVGTTCRHEHVRTGVHCVFI